MHHSGFSIPHWALCPSVDYFDRPLNAGADKHHFLTRPRTRDLFNSTAGYHGSKREGRRWQSTSEPVDVYPVQCDVISETWKQDLVVTWKL